MTRVRPSGEAPEVMVPAATRVPGMSGAPRSAGVLHPAGAAIARVAGVSCRVAR